ncbi:MAG: transposase [Methylocella sp.]
MVRARSKATFSRGHPRFGATQKGGVNGAVLIAFVKRSIAGGKREIFSIADRGPARNARKTRAFVKGPKRKSRLFYLPSYAPDRDPGERVWKHPKAATAGRMVFTGRACFQREVRPSLRHLQNDPGEIISFFPKRSLQYAA